MSAPAAEDIFLARASFAQKRLWVLNRLEPDSPAFNICSAVELTGRLDTPKLASALQHVVDRHEALRTTFCEENGEPFQLIAGRLLVPLEPEDIAELDVEAIVRDEFERPFRLTGSPLLRVRLLRLAADRYILLAVIHHIAADGWSMGRLVGEIVRLYRGEALEPLTLQYADFAEWQHEYLSGPRLESLLSFWVKQLRGSPALSPMATDYPRTGAPRFECGTVRFSIDDKLTASLRQLSAASGATLFMTLLAAFACVLSRYGAEYDIPIGTPVANRNRKELEPLIGIFVNTLVLRADLSGDPSFRDLIARIRAVALDAYEHQDLPFEKIVEALQPGRSAAYTPLFQTMFVFQNAAGEDAGFAGLQLRPLPFERTRTMFDLTMTIEETASGLSGALEYGAALFARETMVSFCRHFHNALNGAASQPGCRISDLAILDARDHEQLSRWSGRPVPYPREQTIHGLFEMQVEATPSAVALVQGDRSITFAELNGRAEVVAAALIERGVRPDSPVVVCMERSPELICAAIGILKAGAGYLAIDPMWPAERIGMLTRDSDAAVIIGKTGLVSRIPALADRILEYPAAFEGHSGTRPRCGSGPGHLAYVSYTSGSTGTPKGVSVPHRAVVRLVKSADYITLGPAETVLMFAPLSFDASTLELWGTLLNGGKLVLAPPMASLPELARCIRENGVTTCWLSAGLFQAMVEEHLDDLSGVRQLVAGGDVLSPAHVSRFLKAAPQSRLINGYGPTENTTFTCCYPVSGSLSAGTVPIGYPIPNTWVYIVDRNLQLTPPGVPGELVTGGDGLARCYLNRAALTAEAFVPNPFEVNTGAGSRIYRTGDLARRRPDGAIEFLGRRDRQIKIRGFRVEPGEVEAVLMRQPGIQEAAVDIRGNETTKELIAWLVPRPGLHPETRALRAALRETLADYMIPSEFVFVDALPLNANGKIDRAALPLGPAPESEPAALVSPVEIRLARLWTELLGQTDLQRTSDFFRCGGHSLLASQLVSRVRREFKVELPLRRIFESPLLQDQAEAIEAATFQGDSGRIGPAGRDRPLPLSHSQERLWLVQSMEPGSTAYNVPAVLRLHGALDRSALEKSLQAIVDRHEILRTRFPAIDGKPVQIIVPSLHVNVTLTDLQMAGADGERQIAARIDANTAHVFDLSTAPLLRAELICLSAEEHILLTSMHHIVCDGWSVGIFVGEWKALYAHFASGAPYRLRSLEIQYADYAAWERRADSGTADGPAFWKSLLETAPSFLAIPVDFPRPAGQSFRGASCPFRIEPETGALLRSLAASSSATMFMTALAAFGLLLSRYAERDMVVIASAVANRDRHELEPLIGCFVNTLPLPVNVEGDPTFTELLSRVRQMAIAAYAHQATPFEHIVAALGVTRAAGYVPLGQVGFALQTFSIPELTLPGLDIALVESEARTAKAEITLALSDGADGLTGAIEFNTDLFEPATIRAVAADFVRLAGVIGTNPGLRCAELLEKAEAGAMPLASLPENRSNLTRGQMLTWLGQSLSPEEPAFNVGMLMTIPSAIDARMFEDCIRTLIRSSDAMRTVFRDVDGVPRQVVREDVAFTLDTLDVSDQPDPARLQNWAESRLSRPFDTGSRCFDMALARLGPELHMWYFGAHHLIADGLAISILFRHLSELYGQAQAGVLPEVISLPSYGQHVAWERRMRSSRQYRVAEAWWRTQLERPAEPLAFYGLPAKHNTSHVESLICELGDERSRRLRALAGASEAARASDRRVLFGFFGAILTSLLCRISGSFSDEALSGSSEMAVGLSFHNRRNRPAKATIGHFMTVVPIRMKLSPATDTVEALARRFGITAFEAFGHAAYAVGNPPSRRNYEVFYNYQLNTFPQFHGKAVSTRRILTNREEDPFALHITDYGEMGNIGVQMDFNCSDFSVGQRRLTLDLFLRLIDACLDNPKASLHTMDLLSPAERTRLLSPPTRLEFAVDRTVQGLFEEQVRMNPTAEALIDGETAMSYSELDAAANRLAAALQGSGVSPETMVGILLSRGAAQIVALLAVLKAGGAYVPIDADLPAERIRYTIRDCGAKVVVSESQHCSALRDLPVAFLCLDMRDEGDEREWRAPALSPGNAAYAIYTSGSSGRPKGVVVTHGGLLNAFHAWRSVYTPETLKGRHLQMANFSFDVFTGDWVRALCSGGALVICPRDYLLSPDLLAGLIRDRRIGCAEFVPAVARTLVAHLSETGGTLLSFRVCIVGSDSWTADEYREMEAVRGPDTRLINSYGLTEATIDSSCFESPDCDRLTSGTCVPLGRPLANMQLHILDQQGRPAVPGIPGELCIGGAGLARGYLGNPTLTAERFVPHPFGHTPGERIYRTGDRARLNDTGDVEFLGRMDNQVKLRGYRIHPTEIETALTMHPRVRYAAVVLQDAPPASKLVAWVEADSRAVAPEELRAFLAASLPAYMVPAAFVFRDSLPLTPSGKIDRRALPQAPPETGGESRVAPRNEVEEQLAAIWTEVLRLTEIGVYDNFFQIGGNSLLASQIVSRTSKALGVAVPLRSLFEQPTIAGQAEHVAVLKLVRQASRAPAASEEPDREEGEI